MPQMSLQLWPRHTDGGVFFFMPPRTALKTGRASLGENRGQFQGSRGARCDCYVVASHTELSHHHLTC